MKIAQVCPYDWSRPGGVKSHIENLAIYLRKMGHEVKIIAPNVNADAITDPNVKLIGKGRSTNLWGGTEIDINIARGKEVTALKSYLEDEQFDLLHFHNGWTPFMTYQVRYYSKAKHVGTFHDTPADTFLAQHFVGPILMPLAASLIWKVADHMISVSESQSRYVKSFLSKNPTIIPNGINPDHFNTSFAPIEEYKDGKFNMLFLGRFEERKGLFHTLNVFKTLKSKYADIRLLIAGDGEQRQEAFDFVAEHHLEDVIFLGFIDEAIKASLIRTADVLMATALYGESFGIVLLEAMACGTPVAGYGNEGYLNVIKAPWTEYFPKPRELYTLTNKVEKLYNHPEIRDEISEWGIKEAKKYEWEKITNKVYEVYEQVMKK